MKNQVILRKIKVVETPVEGMSRKEQAIISVRTAVIAFVLSSLVIYLALR